MAEPRVLLMIEDNQGDIGIIIEMLTATDHDVHFDINVAHTLEAGINQAHACDAVLLDLSLPDSTGLQTFTDFRDAVLKRSVWRPTIVVTALDDERIGRQAIREGAQDFLTKGRFDGPTLLRSIMYSIERHHRQEAEAGLAAVVKMMYEVKTEVAALRNEVSETTAAVNMISQREPTYDAALADD